VRKTILLIFVLLCAAGFSGCRPDKRETAAEQKALQKQKAERAKRRAEAIGIHNVDFNNLTYNIEDENRNFSGGKWSASDDSGASAAVKMVIYGSLMRNGREQAVVVLFGNWSGGNIASGVAQVFDYHAGRAWETASLPGAEASINNGKLIVTSQEWDDGDPLCCPSLKVTRTYHWSGAEFTLTAKNQIKNN
jgi:hypothetical protein